MLSGKDTQYAVPPVPAHNLKMDPADHFRGEFDPGKKRVVERPVKTRFPDFGGR
jgi:hypothetical protein